MRMQHWQDLVSLVLGLWLMVSPLALDFRGVPAGVTVILGIFVVLLAIEALLLPSYLEEIGEISVGLGLLFAPWAVGYASTVAGYSSVIVAGLVIVVAFWELMTDREFVTWWQKQLKHIAR